MYEAFVAMHKSLTENERVSVVFAHKDPQAWETLVASLIRAGFVVQASWPIQTERVDRTRALAEAALASSVWLVCKKRPEAARPGWGNAVLDEMRENIGARLREYWTIGEPVSANLPVDYPLFNAPFALIRILDCDLAAAGIAKRDDRGRTVDVHAMWYTVGDPRTCNRPFDWH
jgi:hypothetical protein